jgi:hypothetical protein
MLNKTFSTTEVFIFLLVLTLCNDAVSFIGYVESNAKIVI